MWLNVTEEILNGKLYFCAMSVGNGLLYQKLLRGP